MSWFSPHTHTPRPVQNEVEAFWYLNLTPEQQEAYRQFSDHLRQTNSLLHGHDDQYTLLRFLKARQWDVHRAATMYQTMVKWRNEHQPDKVYETFTFPEREAVLKHYPHFYHKTDKYGRPVYIELLGHTDAHKILEATTLERLVNYHIYEWEVLIRKILPSCSILAGRPIITKNVVLDLKNVSMKTFGSAAQKILRTIVHIDQDYYCESLGQMFIVNTPTVFRLIWAMVNPLLEDRTRRKIVILGTDFLPTLTQLVPLENLPACLGGTSYAQDMMTSVGPWTAVELPGEVHGEVAAKAASAGADGEEDADLAVKVDAAAVEPGPLRTAVTAPTRDNLAQ